MYQGHLPNSNPVQKHSAGDIYPCTIVQIGSEKYLVHQSVHIHCPRYMNIYAPRFFAKRN